MSSNVSRKTLASVTINGQPVCVRCGRRPVRPSNGKRKRQSYCNQCHADYCFERREGKIQVLLTAEEWAIVKQARAAEARGRHHRR